MALNFVRRSSKLFLLGAGSLGRNDTPGKVMRLAKTCRRVCCSHSTSASLTSTESKKPQVPDEVSCYATRSHTCGELTRKHVGNTVCLKGWLHSNRSKFLLLRDAYGTTQILLEDLPANFQNTLDSLTLESVIEIRGIVSLRPENQINRKMKTGEIEVVATHLGILGPAPQQMPFPVKDIRKMPSDHLRMKYRYLYLRYPHMQETLRIRSQLIHGMRDFLIQRDFVDVETPTLFRKTPGGAQEFIVPTQIPGQFYSLVQSPQQFKQLLMVGGLDRYFQIARCYRDETVRYDRQPEFTQLDIELSFVDREGIISLIEELIKTCWPSERERPSIPIPRMTFHDAMENYGSDKPDLRFDVKIQNVTHLVQPQTIGSLVKQDSSENLSAKIMVFRGAAGACKKDELNELKRLVESGVHTARLHLVPVKNIKDLKSTFRNELSSEEIDNIVEANNVVPKDLLVLCLGPDPEVLKVLGMTRTLIADALEANGFSVREQHHRFLWVVDFPLFEKGDDGSLQSAHHPFTQPHPDDMHLLDTEPLKVRGLHYDLVLNGSEIGGGSIRISDSVLQKHVLHDLLKVDTSALQHLIDALSFGCPPHGGIALGLDRLVSIICGVKSIREVIAFPKALEGKDPMSGAPAALTKEDAMKYRLPFISH
ncbi:aspartate--tRNA ligase, mitochondrial [Thrips palmi]|uniref:Aspartate--tRNA ligase, mitochondrial n=1 Tax=Thrips palmi TaxID=161013 RepID=A0A6P9A1J4_THRPL|nr:aspartate--tRNA ligase, mitochondrial [Thrips palmi]